MSDSWNRQETIIVLALTLLLVTLWAANVFGSVSINELAEQRCIVPTRSEREQVLCQSDFIAGARAGIEVGRNIKN